MHTRQRKTINRSQADHERAEPMHVEIIGGAFDGMRLILDVVREGPDELRVLELGYTNVIRPLHSSEVANA
jgi:hypothetical protein